jgi:hypothetical protein
LAAFVAVGDPADAHQPEIVGQAKQVRVSDPEISKAYYGRLPGTPVDFTIESPTAFTLYAQLTVPDIPRVHRDHRLTVVGPTGRLAVLTTPPSRWRKFYEPFGGDHYLVGPELRRQVAAGRYTVEVSRPGNRGTYVLAVGEEERWGPAEGVSALVALPAVKRDYFGESLARAWLARTVPAIVILAAALLLVAFVAVRLSKRLIPRK